MSWGGKNGYKECMYHMCVCVWAYMHTWYQNSYYQDALCPKCYNFQISYTKAIQLEGHRPYMACKELTCGLPAHHSLHYSFCCYQVLQGPLPSASAFFSHPLGREYGLWGSEESTQLVHCGIPYGRGAWGVCAAHVAKGWHSLQTSWACNPQAFRSCKALPFKLPLQHHASASFSIRKALCPNSVSATHGREPCYTHSEFPTLSLHVKMNNSSWSKAAEWMCLDTSSSVTPFLLGILHKNVKIQGTNWSIVDKQKDWGKEAEVKERE